MLELIPYIWQYLVQALGLFIAFLAAAILLFILLRQHYSKFVTLVMIAVFVGISIFFYIPNSLPHAFEFPFNLKTYGPSDGPELPFKNILNFFLNFKNFEKVKDIAHDPNNIPGPLNRNYSTTVKIDLNAKEVISEIAPGVYQNYWTFDGTVPGPFLRVREGDTVELTLYNDKTSLHAHSIDLHAVTGPGGGAVSTMVEPGESKTVKFKALHPGIFVYHCAHANVAVHMSHGMYGMILVEPKNGLEKVDHEYYVMQGELYTTGALGKKGLQIFETEAMLDSKPQYIVFNGRTGALTQNMSAKTGEKIRIFFGNGGVNLISSFHLIGEIFDKVYREGDLKSPPAQSIQTTLVPAGGATMVEVGLDVPGNYILVDHALSRMDRGAWGILKVTGDKNENIYDGEIMGGMGH
jgi:nitrite reductase (NO-forming)